MVPFAGLVAARAVAGTRIARHCAVVCDAMRVVHGQVVKLGSLEIRVLETPGHTPESVSYYLPQIEGGAVLTGDALLIGTCGRTDFQGGDAGALWDSVQHKLFTLPDATIVLPAHDYNGRTQSTVGDEKRGNKRLANHTRDEFVSLMAHLGLPPPKKMSCLPFTTPVEGERPPGGRRAI